MPIESSAAHESGEFEIACADGYDADDEESERYDAAARDYTQFVNPHVSDQLERLALDKCFVRGEGHLLFDAEGNRYLDAVSGYGAVPFGHNLGWIWQAVRDFEHGGEPCMVQPSLLPGAGELAEALIRHAPAGLRYVTFGNTGAEAVALAIAACRAATGKAGVVSTLGGAHGEADGILSGGGRARPQGREAAQTPRCGLVPYGDGDALERALRDQGERTAAFIVEPVQGKGGVVEPPAGYLQHARRLCDRHGVLLVVDETETGLGRTGTLFACLHEGITPDVMTLANALGGGLVPVSACLLSARAYSKDFAFEHASTFAGNGLATRVALRVLERLTSDDERLLEHVTRQGAYLKRGLCAVARDYGSVVRDVRGRGLMLGVELRDGPPVTEPGAHSPAAWGAGLGLAAASHLLNAGGVRVAPARNGSSVLRVQPALTVTREECDWIIRAFRELASTLASGRTDGLLLHCPGDHRAITNAPDEHDPSGGAVTPGFFREVDRDAPSIRTDE
jgi:acetylornithine/succinyldiaminopimelate/putrescine aminotransferase